MKEQTIEQTKNFVNMVAKNKGWILNPDEEFVAMLIEGLNTNVNRYGFYCCPCRDSDGEKEEDRDIICPCDYCVPDQEEFGHCYCGLYLTQEFAKKGIPPEALPERRQ